MSFPKKAISIIGEPGKQAGLFADAAEDAG